MPSINLAPGTQQVAAAQRRRRRLYTLTFFIFFLVAVIWAGLFLYQQQLEAQAEDIQQQLRNVQTETARLSEQADRVRLFETRLTALNGLLNEHINWEPILQGIEGLVPATVAFTRLSANANTGELLLDGTTSDVDQVALALASFLEEQRSSANSIFSSGVLGSIDRKESSTGEEGGVAVSYDFRIELTFRPSLLTASQE